MKRVGWLGLLALAGCGGNGADQQNPMQMSSSYSSASASSKKAVQADPRTETRTVTEKAVTLKFDALKASITLPEGAVAKTESVTGSVPVDLKVADPVVPDTVMAFEGPTFAKPVELIVQKPKKKGDLYLAEYRDKKWADTKADVDKKTNTFHYTTSTLGTYAVLVRPKVTKEQAKKIADSMAGIRMSIK